MRRKILLILGAVVVLFLENAGISFSSEASTNGSDYHVFLPTLQKPPNPRSINDLPDDNTGYQIKIVYAIPSDGEDRAFDLDGSLSMSTATYLNWLNEQTAGTTLRLDTYNGDPDIMFVILPRTDAQYRALDPNIRNIVDDDMKVMGLLTDPKKIYAVYYDGSSDWSCGGGAWPPELIGQVAALYLKGLPNEPIPCDSNTFATDIDDWGYFESAMLHEIMHTLGLVPTCGTNHYLRGHTSDFNNDLMWSGAQPWDIFNLQLDINNDDYYQHNIPGCPDLAKSVFMNPLPASPELPPDW